MSKFITKEIRRKNVTIYNTGDWHVGSLAFHEDAARELVNRVASENAYITFGGDMIEGKSTDSPHFNPSGLRPNEINIHLQADAFVELLKPIRKRILLIHPGNHEINGISKDFNIVSYICEKLGVKGVEGDYQTWLKLNGVTMHFWHGRTSMPKGAKDMIQREANRMAWLKNILAPLAGSAKVHYMGHTHHCMIVPPVEKYALLNSGEDVKGRYFIEPDQVIDGEPWVPIDSRWYVNTGTLRRNGGFSYIDYSEVAGYTPPVMAFTKTVLSGTEVVSIEKVVV